MRLGSNERRHVYWLLALELGSVNMDIPIEYRRVKPGDEDSVHKFISDVFNQFVAPEFSQEGIDEFMTYVQPDALAGHLKTDHFGIIASSGSDIIGVIVVRQHSHVALFFVDARYQRSGIGRKLLSKALEICDRHGGKPSKLTVNASPNSKSAYEKFNFEATDTEQCLLFFGDLHNRDVVDQVTQHTLFVFGLGGRSIPYATKIFCQAKHLSPLGGRNDQALLVLKLGKGLPCLLHFEQRVIPLTFQIGGDETIRRIHFLVAALSELRLVLRSFHPHVPLFAGRLIALLDFPQRLGGNLDLMRL